MPDSDLTGERSRAILREIDLLRKSVTDSIESLTAKFESMQKTLLDSYGGRISAIEQWQVRAVDDHAKMTERIEGLPTLDVVETKIELAAANLATAVSAKVEAATARRDEQLAVARVKEEEKMAERDRTLSRHDTILKIVSALAGMIAVASVGAMFKFFATTSANVDRLERLESTVNAPGQHRKEGN